MYDSNKARLEEMRARFDGAAAERSPDTRRVADEYLAELTGLIDSFNAGPAADPAVAGMDTTGQIARTEELVEWAERERHRVRRALNEVA